MIGEGVMSAMVAGGRGSRVDGGQRAGREATVEEKGVM